MYRNNAELIEAFNRGEKLKYLFFWGHTQPKDGSINKSCFSQWYPSPFEVEGIHYATAEHFMMAEKARCFNDSEMEQQIIQCSCPKEAKSYGRAVRNFAPSVWDAQGYASVVKGNIAKFSQHRSMREYLLTTKNRIIVEASPRDRVWGIGMDQSNPQAENPNFWQGHNLLGYALMETRKALE